MPRRPRSRALTDYAVRGAPIDQVQPFGFDGGPIGCVLLHGFTAAPKEMRPLGEFLAARHFTVRGVRYAGHGTCPQDLARTTYHDWIASARSAVDDLRGRCRRVWAIGLSLGGLISLHLAAQHQVDGVVALAPPIYPTDRRLWLAQFLWRFKPYSVKSLADLHDAAALAGHADYELFPLRAVAQLHALTRRVRREAAAIDAPLLVIMARHDRVVQLRSADFILKRAPSAVKEQVIVERGGHIITEDHDKAAAFEAIAMFLSQHAG